MIQALTLVLFMALGGVALAQEDATKPAAGDPPPDQPAAPATEAAGEPEPATTTAPTPSAAAKSPDSFTPSEEISEDLSVSFPVDI